MKYLNNSELVALKKEVFANFKNFYEKCVNMDKDHCYEIMSNYNENCLIMDRFFSELILDLTFHKKNTNNWFLSIVVVDYINDKRLNNLNFQVKEATIQLIIQIYNVIIGISDQILIIL